MVGMKKKTRDVLGENPLVSMYDEECECEESTVLFFSELL